MTWGGPSPTSDVVMAARDLVRIMRSLVPAPGRPPLLQERLVNDALIGIRALDRLEAALRRYDQADRAS